MFQQDKPKSFMQELDLWSDEHVIGPLIDPHYSDPAENREATIARVKKAIREKVLESYRNGQGAGPAKAGARRSYAKR
ncbi:MAG: hypothetical protein AB1540_15735 [Bdellovibrionota bacterium]